MEAAITLILKYLEGQEKLACCKELDKVLFRFPIRKEVDQAGVSVPAAMEAGILHQEQYCRKTNLYYYA